MNTLKKAKYEYDSKDHLELQEPSRTSECTPLKDHSIDNISSSDLVDGNTSRKKKYELIKRLIHENKTIRNKIIKIRKEMEILKRKFDTLSSSAQYKVQYQQN